MKIVLPICHKDWQLMVANLEWCLKMEPEGVLYEAILAHDDELPLEGFEAVKKLAESYFKKLDIFHYDAPADKKWPAVANHVWQRVAWHFWEMQATQHWFWWEPDACPLRPGWIAAIEWEYLKWEQPFGGHIVRGLGHMNGVAVYPPNVPKFAQDCMHSAAAPWDVVLSSECPKQISCLNRVIGHYPRWSGYGLRVTRPEVAGYIQKSGMAIFHGITDNTLIQWLDTGQAVMGHGGIYRALMIEDLNKDYDEAESIYQKTAVELRGKDWPICNFDATQWDYPEFQEQQTIWETGIFNLEHDWNTVNFNPGLVDDGKQLILVARRWERCGIQGWHSELVACRLDRETMLVHERKILKFPNNSIMHEVEDSRVVWDGKHFHVLHSEWARGKIYKSRQIRSIFDQDWNFVREVVPPVGGNSFDNDIIEKNWLPFIHDGQFYMVYSFDPHRIFDETCNFEQTDPPKIWPYGEIRGGTPPVRVGDEYLTFFHSSLPWRKRQRRYFMGAYTFEAKPPFAVKRITKSPLLAGSEHDARLLKGPLVIFPCGAVLQDRHWLVTFGVNDEQCGWIKIPQTDLDELLCIP